jgi:hypothetical protein
MTDPTVDAPLTADEIAAIKARSDAATPGPWTVIAEGYDGVGDLKMGPDGAEVVTLDLGGIAYCSDPYPRGDNCPSENMMFIAHAREDVPRLIAALEVVTAALAAAEAKLAAVAAEADAHEERASQFSRGNDDGAVIHRLAARGIRAALSGGQQDG